jgi:hypothetical protein
LDALREGVLEDALEDVFEDVLDPFERDASRPAMPLFRAKSFPEGEEKGPLEEEEDNRSAALALNTRGRDDALRWPPELRRRRQVVEPSLS